MKPVRAVKPVSDAEITVALALCRAATEGPWKASLPAHARSGCRAIKGAKSGKSRQAHYREVAYTVGLSDDAEDRANARLIAIARTLLPRLLLTLRSERAARRGALSV